MTGLLLILFLFLNPNFALAAENIAAPSVVPPPTINISPDTYYPLDENLYLEGRSLPNARVELFFEKQSGGADPVRLNINANSNGEWFFAQKLEMASGEWMARARVLGNAPSEWSNPKIIRSVVSGFFLGSIKIKYLPVIIVLVSLFIIGIILLIYSLLRVKTIERLELERQIEQKTKAFEKSLHEKEMEAVVTLVEENFTDIRRKITEELAHLEKQLSERGVLSNEEQEHRNSLLAQLHDAEETIEKKIKGMD